MNTQDWKGLLAFWISMVCHSREALGEWDISTLTSIHLGRGKEKKGKEGTPDPDTGHQLRPPCLWSPGGHGHC